MKTDKLRTFVADEETLKAIKTLKENGISMSFVIRKAIQEAANKIKN